ncbi:MAG: radical SAM protein [Candidatus Nezhaarchaeales archaeon]
MFRPKEHLGMDLARRVKFLEYNVIVKSWKKSKLKIALCYPNIYRAGMTGLTVQQLYYLFNLDDDVLCERCFLSNPPRTIESCAELKSFDVVAFTLQYEEDYINMVKMLIDAGINPLAERRNEADPLVIAGGQAVSANPLPLSKIVDCVFVGELEPCLDVLLEALKKGKNRKSRIEELSNLKHIYYYGKEKAERCIAKDLDKTPHILAQLAPGNGDVPIDPIFTNAFCLEVSRSCNRKCRFCLLSWTNGPLRFRSLNKIKELLDEGLLRSKADRVVLIGAGIFDVPWLKDICAEVLSRGLGLSIPSLRPDVIDDELLEFIKRGGQRSLALGVESFSSIDRAFLGKVYDDEAIESAIKMAIDKGLTEVKLYIITCLPREDVDGSAKLFERIIKIVSKSKVALHISVNPLIPKAHTPFQWLTPPSPYMIKESYRKYLRIFRHPRVRLDFLNPHRAAFQAILSLGDENLGPYLVDLAKRGLKSWSFMVKVLPKVSLEPGAQTPWDVIDVGYDRKVLLKSFEEAMSLISNKLA